MNSDQQIWRVWADTLHRWGWHHFVADLLVTAGPLSILGAQLVLFSQPILELFLPEADLEALNRVLEDPDKTRQFINHLKESRPY